MGAWPLSGVAVKKGSTVYTCSYSLGLTCCKELNSVPRCPALRFHLLKWFVHPKFVWRVVSIVKMHLTHTFTGWSYSAVQGM